MAKHVDKVSDINVPALDCLAFARQLQQADILFFSGCEPISIAIERETDSPWSHVGYVWLPEGIEPLFLEAVFKFGVRAARLANYIGSYDGDIVLCRRSPGLIPPQGQMAILKRAISRLGADYDWQSEVQQAAHKMFGFLPEGATPNRLYCSGLLQYASQAWAPPLQKPNQDVAPSPEQNWTDPTVWPVCKLLKGQK